MHEERVDAFVRSDFLPEILKALHTGRSETVQRLAAATTGNLYGVGTYPLQRCLHEERCR